MSVENVDDIIKDLIARMILKSNYWGYVFSKLSRKEDTTIKSIMGVSPEPDGRLCLVYNPLYFKNTKEQTLVYIMHHEGIHLLNKHIPRLIRILRDLADKNQEQTNIKLWNIAADFTANDYSEMPKVIELAGFKFELAFPDMFGLPQKQITEWYFQQLLQIVNNTKKSAGNISGSGFRAVGKKEDKSGQGDQGSEDKQGKGTSSLPDNLDDHSGWSKVFNQVSDPSTLAQKVEDFTKTIIRESLREFNTTRGLLPAGIQELINKLFEPPKAPYYEIIKKLIRGSRKSKFKRCFTRINRKRTYAFAIDDKSGVPRISPFPGKKRDYTFNIGILSDTSGSMSPDMIRDALSGAKNIIEKDRHCKTTMIEVDAKVQKEYLIKRISDIDFDIRGRGGTFLFPALERFKELEVDVVLAFTDAACENVNEISRKLLPKRIIWVVREGFSVSLIDKTGYIVRTPGKWK